MATIKCTAAGDAMVMRRLPGSYPGFEELKNFISQGDFRFFNLETTIHNHETYGAAISGGTWFCSPPEVLEDARNLALTFCPLPTTTHWIMPTSVWKRPLTT
jgi:hypothetical protein